MTSNFRREVRNVLLWANYAASSGNFFSAFGNTYRSLEYGADRLFRNVGKELPLFPA